MRVGRCLAIGEGGVNAIKLELGVDVLLLDLDVRGDVDCLGSHIGGLGRDSVSGSDLVLVCRFDRRGLYRVYSWCGRRLNSLW